MTTNVLSMFYNMHWIHTSDVLMLPVRIVNKGPLEAKVGN
jgi:hypothetical protein